MKFFAFVLYGLVTILPQGYAQQETTAVSKVIHDIQKRYAVQVIYKTNDIVDESDREFKIVGKLNDFSPDKALRAIALSCGLEMMKMNEQSYVLKPILPDMEQALKEKLQRLEDLESALTTVSRRLKNLEADSRKSSGKLDRMERQVERIDSELALLIMSRL